MNDDTSVMSKNSVEHRKLMIFLSEVRRLVGDKARFLSLLPLITNLPAAASSSVFQDS
jgi:hypothetical protein